MRTLAFLALLLTLGLYEAAPAPVQGHEAMHKNDSCRYCGMDRQKFAHSAMMIKYEDGTSTATCSIHCAAIDLAEQIGKTPKSIQVGDFNSKKQIDAEKACWVIGGDVTGVMTRRAKWAFESETDCRNFVKEHGGRIASFDEAMEATYMDMYLDTKMIREKRKAMTERRLHE